MKKSEPKPKTAVAQIRERYFARKQDRKPPGQEILDVFKKRSSNEKDHKVPEKKIAKPRDPEAGL